MKKLKFDGMKWAMAYKKVLAVVATVAVGLASAMFVTDVAYSVEKPETVSAGAPSKEAMLTLVDTPEAKMYNRTYASAKIINLPEMMEEYGWEPTKHSGMVQTEVDGNNYVYLDACHSLASGGDNYRFTVSVIAQYIERESDGGTLFFCVTKNNEKLLSTAVRYDDDGINFADNIWYSVYLGTYDEIPYYTDLNQTQMMELVNFLNLAQAEEYGYNPVFTYARG